MHFEDTTIYIVGDAKSPQNNPIMEVYKAFFVGIVVDRKTAIIVDVECSATLGLTNSFVKSLLIGKNVLSPDVIDCINTRYFGSSQKAFGVALKDAQKKYQQIMQSESK
ncbi:DUF3870 domain-containing protein [Wohlfahrtiimonas larvae]|uniref:DUF3870 domain-containing protein n=1 Tax=Wohlfahrtiimonas larvae TaxID=1157986 RepID=A0ABP9MTN3_9GAMM|nr:DUF3870 domain-containing protein [Wohlfahrtiimonas larvae]